MTIKEEIQRLQRLESKIALYETLIEWVRELAAPACEAEVYTEFAREIQTIVESKINEINGLTTVPIRQSAPVSSKEVIVPPPVAQTDEPTDPLKFLLKYRHLDRKRIIYKSKDGEVPGIVCGLIAPLIKIMTDTGFMINVPPRDIKEVSNG